MAKVPSQPKLIDKLGRSNAINPHKPSKSTLNGREWDADSSTMRSAAASGIDTAEARTQGRLLAVGDIHGCIMPLEAVIETLRPTEADTLVILGDFVDRGPATREVIERLIALQAEIHLVIILGNHEEEMLAARHDPQAYLHWLSMGGESTLASYSPGAQLEDIPAGHWQLMEEALDWWECENFFFTHANYAPDLPLEQQPALDLRWIDLMARTVQPHISGKTAIVGHTPNLAGQVRDFGFLRCLDTGCGLGGCLSMMDIRTKEIWQCDETSQSVKWCEAVS